MQGRKAGSLRLLVREFISTGGIQGSSVANSVCLQPFLFFRKIMDVV